MVISGEKTKGIVGAAIEVHRRLGPGLLESAYRRCLVIELEERGHVVVAEATLDIDYRGHRIPGGYRLDLLVNDEVIVEIKSVEHVLPVHKAQLLTYLRLSDRRLGLLLNFNVPALRHGITRMVL